MSWFLFFIALLVLLVFFVVWSYYPRKGEREEKNREQLPEKKLEMVQVPPVDAVKAVLIQRIEGIKRKNARSISGLVDIKRYTKFDDWPPFERQNSRALDREAEALKVLKEYDYEVSDWMVDIFGDTALATFVIKYRGTIRNLQFNIHSRVTAFLVKQEGGWRLIHEHWSRFTEKVQKEE